MKRLMMSCVLFTDDKEEKEEEEEEKEVEPENDN